MMQNKTKLFVAVLAASAAFFAGLIKYEGYSAVPYRDVGNVATIGLGSTQYPDGKRVTMDDKPITKHQAVVIARAHVGKDEAAFRRSLPGVALSQAEYDLYLDFVYQYGLGAWHKSSMRRLLLQKKYRPACDALLRYKFAGGRDCSVRKNGCYGVWARQLDRHKQCVEANR